MLKKKILSILLVLGLGTVCITQGNYINFAPNTDTVIGTNTVNCDEYFNCTTIKNGITYNGLQLTNSYSRDMIRFWNTNNTIGKILNTVNWGANQSFGGELNTGTTLKITDYTTSLTYDNGACDYLPTKGGITVENRYETYKGKKITSYNISNVNNGGSCFCFNYNEELGSVCIQDPGIDRANYGFTSNDYGLNGARYTNENLQIGTSQLEGDGGGGEQGGYTKLPMCYTIQQKINTFPSNYNIDMCYSTNKIWSGNQFVTVTPKSMLELRPTYQEYVNDVNLYQNYCGNYVTNNTACGEAFSGKEDKRSIINKLYNQGTQTILRSYDYCYLQLNFTEEQKNTRTNCTMGTGLQHGSGITTDEIIEDMQNHRITIIAPDGTTVYSGFRNNNGEDENANQSFDGIIETMQRVRGKLTNIFYYRSGVTGIIPDYITRILLLIVLFAIFKK